MRSGSLLARMELEDGLAEMGKRLENCKALVWAYEKYSMRLIKFDEGMDTLIRIGSLLYKIGRNKCGK